MSFSSLRSEARTLESVTEKLLSEYSQLSSQPAGEQDTVLRQRIQESLNARRDVINTMSRALETESLNPDAGASVASKSHHLSRAREILADHHREFQRMQTDVQQSRDSANLLSSVQQDINRYKAAQGGGNSAESYMLSERSRIEESHGMTDSILAQAHATREEFTRQRNSLTQLNRRLITSASQIPGLNVLIGKISSRKRRDSIIMAILISFGILFIFFFH